MRKKPGAQGVEAAAHGPSVANGVGDGEEPPGLRGHRRGSQRQVAAVPAGDGVNAFARVTVDRESTRRLTHVLPRLTGSTCSVPALVSSLRLDAGGRGDPTASSLAMTPAAPEGRGELVDVGRRASGPRRS